MAGKIEIYKLNANQYFIINQNYIYVKLITNY